MRANKEFVSGAYSLAEKSESFVINELNEELSRINLKNFKFCPKEEKYGIDIILKNVKTNKIIWFVDVHECQFGPKAGGQWPWPLHLPHGVKNYIKPTRYKANFENIKNFSMILIDLRKRGFWTAEDLTLITKEIISRSNTQEILTNSPGHRRKEPMYMIPYELIKTTSGIKSCISWFVKENIITNY